MKRILKLALAMAALLLVSGTGTASAQKFGYINFQELVFSMPDMKTVEENLQALQTELSEQLEQMQVELNKKMDEYQRTYETMTASIRQMKEQEIESLQQRIQQSYQTAQQTMEKQQAELMQPIIEKARAAVTEVMNAQGFAGIFDAQALVSMNTSQMTDMLPAVKQHLGI